MDDLNRKKLIRELEKAFEELSEIDESVLSNFTPNGWAVYLAAEAAANVFAAHMDGYRAATD